MIHFVLACILWSKPNVKNIKVPVDEYAMATLQAEFNEFLFEATVVEERMNSVKISYRSPADTISADAYSSDLTQRTLTTKLTVGDHQASLDCEVQKINSEK